jgi:hypothetical protein
VKRAALPLWPAIGSPVGNFRPAGSLHELAIPVRSVDMLKVLALGVLLPLSASAHEKCDTINAKFEEESTRTVLRVLSRAAGLELQNPEVVTGALNATFEDENTCTLFPRLAKNLGYQIETRGSKVWLRKA